VNPALVTSAVALVAAVLALLTSMRTMQHQRAQDKLRWQREGTADMLTDIGLGAHRLDSCAGPLTESETALYAELSERMYRARFSVSDALAESLDQLRDGLETFVLTRNEANEQTDPANLVRLPPHTLKKDIEAYEELCRCELGVTITGIKQRPAGDEGRRWLRYLLGSSTELPK
jgi:hypothetical protein